MLAVPFVSDEKYLWMKLSTEYLLVNFRKEFIAKTQYELDSCMSIDKFVKVCENGKQILSSGVMDCEMKLFLSKLKIPNECQYKVIDGFEFWQQLNTENSWIFAMKNSTIGTLKCDGYNSEEITFMGTGTLSLFGNCELETNSYRLFSRYSKWVNESVHLMVMKI